MKKLNKHLLKVIPLGGMNEIGKNMTVIQYGDEIIIIDCGIKFPDEDMYGIDVIVPDYSYLRDNKEKIKGVFLTHGHEDHIGGLPYFLKEFDVPIYGTRLTIGLVEHKLKEHATIKSPKLNVVKQGQNIKMGFFKVEFIRVSHSIPDAVAFAITTPAGVIIHTGDFKIDYVPIDNQVIDLNTFSKYGQKGVLLLLADSTNAERPGNTMSESSVGDKFDLLFHNAQSRIFVASFASNVHRVQQIINAAHSNNRKIVFVGRSMVNIAEVARQLGYLKIPECIQIDANDLHRYPDNEICIISTGSQGEPLAALSRISSGDHRQLEINENDTVIFSSTPIPGNEKDVKRVVDNLMEKGATVIHDSLAEVHVSGHACQEELKLVHSLVKPKYFIPVHGEFSHRKMHALIAQKLGMSKDNIFFPDNGDVVEFDGISAKKGSKVESGVTLIDGLGIEGVGSIVLKDRKMLAEEGLIMAILVVDKSTQMLVSRPEIISRGFVYVRESEDLMEVTKGIVEVSFEKSKTKKANGWSEYKATIRDDLNRYYYQKMKRNPIVIPVIIEV